MQVNVINNEGLQLESMLSVCLGKIHIIHLNIHIQEDVSPPKSQSYRGEMVDSGGGH